MNEKQLKSISKFLSLVLRHKPETIGLTLDEMGWADVSELLSKLKSEFNDISKEHLQEVVSTNDKKRFAFNEDQSKIRASQGHSIEVELNLAAKQPPEFLYHGTVEKFLDAIKAQGLLKMNRQHVHLSNDLDTAKKVGSRRGTPVILTVASGKMYREGFIFYLSENGVWLTDRIDPRFIQF